MLDLPSSVAHDPPRVPVGWRPAGCIVVGALAPVIVVVMSLALIVFVTVDEDRHHGRVPSAAKPAGFKQLARWDECGANGEWCAEVIVFGGNAISFDDAARAIADRYREKGWTVRAFPPDNFADGELALSSSDGKDCIALRKFDIEKYRPDFTGPDRARMARLTEPHETIIEVAAFDCP